MATVYQEFPPGSAAFPASNFGAPTVTQGTNFPVPALAFDATTSEAAYFFFRAVNYGSGNLTLDLDWYADSASSGDVGWGAAVAAITPDTDTQDVETKSFATANTATDSHLGTTGQRLHRATITISNLDSIAAGDWACLKVYRDTSVGSNMSGDALLTKATLCYSDT